MQNISVDKNVINKAILFVIIFFVGYSVVLSWSFLFQNVDDAYISFRYGKNMMSGDGLVYNKGEYVEGYTNFLWTVVTAPFTKIESIDISIFATSFGIIFSVINLLLLSFISRQFTESFPRYSTYLFLLPSLLIALDNTMAFWAIGGMEFPIYIFFILGIIYNYFRLNDSPKHTSYLIIFLILCTLTRPEGNMIFVITLFHMMLFRKRLNEFKPVVIKIILSYVLFCAAYYGFKYFYYGQILPNTFYAKGVTDLSMNLILGVKYVIMCIGFRIYILIFIFFIPFREAFRNFRLSYLILFSFIYVSYIIGVGGDWMYANRFFVPIIPILYLLSVVGLIYFIKKITEYFSNKKTFSELKLRNRFRIFVICLCVALFSISLSNLEYKRLILEEDNANFERQWSRFGQWLKINCPQNTIIAVGPAGKIPYYSELYTVDMWGLNDEHISRLKSTRLQAGHKKFDFEYVLSRKPEFIIGYAGFTDNNIPANFEKFNSPEDYYKCMDIVFRLKKDFRELNK